MSAKLEPVSLAIDRRSFTKASAPAGSLVLGGGATRQTPAQIGPKTAKPTERTRKGFDVRSFNTVQ